MTSASLGLVTPSGSDTAAVQEQIDREIEDVLASFPKLADLSAEERRGIIARYAAVLEGNFIYWMTGALLSIRSEKARSIILENLDDEVRHCHPEMMRRFAMAAGAAPTDLDANAVYGNLLNVRLFIGRLSPLPILTMMAFFEGFIQQFMPYLAELAARQGSSEREYTDFHSVCDVAHTQELLRALEAEMALARDPLPEANSLFEGIELLRRLLRNIVTA
jgi:hypothetical protein